MADISTARRALIYARKRSVVEPTLAARDAAYSAFVSYEQAKRALSGDTWKDEAAVYTAELLSSS